MNAWPGACTIPYHTSKHTSLHMVHITHARSHKHYLLHGLEDVRCEVVRQHGRGDEDLVKICVAGVDGLVDGFLLVTAPPGHTTQHDCHRSHINAD